MAVALCRGALSVVDDPLLDVGQGVAGRCQEAEPSGGGWVGVAPGALVHGRLPVGCDLGEEHERQAGLADLGGGGGADAATPAVGLGFAEQVGEESVLAVTDAVGLGQDFAHGEAQGGLRGCLAGQQVTDPRSADGLRCPPLFVVLDDLPPGGLGFLGHLAADHRWCRDRSRPAAPVAVARGVDAVVGDVVGAVLGDGGGVAGAGGVGFGVEHVAVAVDQVVESHRALTPGGVLDDGDAGVGETPDRGGERGCRFAVLAEPGDGVVPGARVAFGGEHKLLDRVVLPFELGQHRGLGQGQVVAVDRRGWPAPSRRRPGRS